MQNKSKLLQQGAATPRVRRHHGPDNLGRVASKTEERGEDRGVKGRGEERRGGEGRGEERRGEARRGRERREDGRGREGAERVQKQSRREQWKKHACITRQSCAGKLLCPENCSKMMASSVT